MEVARPNQHNVFSRRNYAKGLNGVQHERIEAKATHLKSGSKRTCEPLQKCQQPEVKKGRHFDLSKLKVTLDDVQRKPPSDVVDIDGTKSDYLFNPIYVGDIDYVREREMKFQLAKDYLARNTAITSKSRAIVVDWLISVQNYLQLHGETIHLAITLLDQYLARRKVSLAKLQLIGITSLLVAAKFHERFPPTFDTLLSLTENAYKESELVAAERLLLTTLHFEVNIPTCQVLLDRYMKAVQTDMDGDSAKKVRRAAAYLLDLSLTDSKMVSVLPSSKAAAAVWVARRMLHKDPAFRTWPPTMVYYTSMKETTVRPVTCRLVQSLLHAEKSKLQGARNRHASKSRMGAISLDPALNDEDKLWRIVDMDVTSL